MFEGDELIVYRFQCCFCHIEGILDILVSVDDAFQGTGANWVCHADAQHSCERTDKWDGENKVAL